MPRNEDEAVALVDAYLERATTDVRLAKIEPRGSGAGTAPGRCRSRRLGGRRSRRRSRGRTSRRRCPRPLGGGLRDEVARAEADENRPGNEPGNIGS
jgi:hypothetical protein